MAVLVAGVVVYEVAAPDGQLISHGMDRLRARSVVLDVAAHVVVVVTAAHLLRLLPARWDPYTWCHSVTRRPSAGAADSAVTSTDNVFSLVNYRHDKRSPSPVHHA